MRVEPQQDKENRSMRAHNLPFRILSLKNKRSLIGQSDAPHA